MPAFLLLLLLAPDDIVRRVYDVNGQAVPAGRTESAGGSRVTMIRNANGREVPVESVEERVVADGIVERTIRRYDPSGNPGPVERVRIETRKAPDGSVEAVTTVQRGDINGKLAVIERSTAVTRGTQTVETIERVGMTGGLQLTERRETARKPSGETTVVQQLDANGRLYQSGRTSLERTSTTENRAEYESTNGQMQLVRQTVTRRDGDRTEVDVFTPGPQGEPRLAQRQIVEKTRSNGGFTSAVSVQLTDGSGRLTSPRLVEETICKGECVAK